jgi:16S rRNA (uracil1498-N3)-methyltransferase
MSPPAASSGSRPAHPADEPGPMAFVDDLQRPVLEPADRHHLERVLRMRTGDRLTVADGAGRWRPAVFGAAIVPTGEVLEHPAAEPAVTVCFALLKGERPELVVQKLTELGVDRIVPFAAARSVVRWDRLRAARNVERLRAVARAAAAQAHRARLPEVAEVATFDQVAALPGAARCERDGRPPTIKHPVLLVGPEGGWSDEERAALTPAVALAGHVLRSETAAVVAGGFLTALRAGTVRASGARRHAV